jgi:hypothetical protein
MRRWLPVRRRWNRGGDPKPFGPSADIDGIVHPFLDALASARWGQPAEGHGGFPLEQVNALIREGEAARSTYRGSGSSTRHLDTAVDCAERALALVPAGSEVAALVSNNLGIALRDRFERHHAPPEVDAMADLDRSVRVLRDAVAWLPIDHERRPRHLANLGGSLQTRFRGTGRTEDIDDAVDALQEALRLTPARDPNRLDRLELVGGALAARLHATLNVLDIDRAVTCGEEVLAGTPSEHPRHGDRLFNLAGFHETRYGFALNSEDRERAIRYARTCLRLDTAPPMLRARAGFLSARLASAEERWADADTTYRSVMGLLPSVVRQDLGREDRQHHLALLEGLGREAAANALDREDPGGAWDLLERGRGVLLRHGRFKIGDLG